MDRMHSAIRFDSNKFIKKESIDSTKITQGKAK